MRNVKISAVNVIVTTKTSATEKNKFERVEIATELTQFHMNGTATAIIYVKNHVYK